MAKVSHEIRVKAPRDRVFQALSTAEGLKGWYTAHVEGDILEGKEAIFRFTDKEPFRWRFAKLSPNRPIHWECVEGPGAAAGTSVMFRLKETPDKRTLVEFDHEGWPEAHEALTTCNTLWGILMGHLKNYAETTKVAPAFR